MTSSIFKIPGFELLKKCCANCSVGRRFGAGLGSGLDAQSEALLRGEWGGIRATREEVSEDEYEE